MGFIECKICASKPGSPILCDSCLSNRAAIAQLEERIKEKEMEIDKMQHGIIVNVHVTDQTVDVSAEIGRNTRRIMK